MRLTNASNRATKAISLRLNAFVIFLCFLCLPTKTWALSDKRLCADPKCEQIISLGTTKLKYATGGEGLLSFNINTPVRILSKSAGSDPKLWGVEINGRRGYANKDFILEKKVMIKEADLRHEVPVKADAAPPAQQAKETVLVSEEQRGPSPDGATTTATTPGPALASTPAAAATTAPVQEQAQPAATTPAAVPVAASASIEEKVSEPPVRNETTTTEPEPVQDKPSIELKEEPVLKASESNDEAITTTTSPLQEVQIDAAKPTINTQNDNSNESLTTPAPSTPVQPNVKLVDGTALPLEAEPAAAQLPSSYGKRADPEAEKYQFLDQFGAQPANETQERLKRKLSEEETLNDDNEEDDDDFDYEEEDADEILDETEESDGEKALDDIREEAARVDEEIAAKDMERELREAGIPLTISSSTPLPPTLQPELRENILDTRNGTTEIPEVYKKEASSAEKKEDTPEDPVEALLNKNANEDKEDERVEATKENNELIEENSKEQVVTEDKSDNLESVKETKPLDAPEPPANLPPLFQHSVDYDYADPNEFYKKLQETQNQQASNENLSSESNDPNGQQAEHATPKPSDTYGQQAEHATPKPSDTYGQQAEQPTLKPIDPYSQQAEQPTPKPIDPYSQQPEQATPKPNDPYGQEAEHATPKPSDPYGQQPEQATPKPSSPYDQQAEHATPKPIDPYSQQAEHVTPKPNDPYGQQPEHTTPSPYAYESPYESANYEAETTPAPRAEVEPVTEQTKQVITEEEETPKALPSLATTTEDSGTGLFATIMGTVNNFISNQGKEPKTEPLSGQGDELQRILYPGMDEPESGHCYRPQGLDLNNHCHASISLDNFPEVMAAQLVEHSQLLLCVVIAAASSLFFIFTYYCFCNSSQEGSLLSKLNLLERSLLAAHKENHILKHDLMTTRTKLSSIEDNSFGSNDMVVALKKQLETELYEKAKLQEQVGSLEKDLDNAAEAGLELNKMLSEVLSTSSGDDAFMRTVDELQRQLNDQEKIIIDINSSLAEKSRENSELQYSYTESTTRLNAEMKALQQDNYELEMEKAKLQTRLDEVQAETEKELAKALEGRNYEMQRLQNQILDWTVKWEKEHSDLQTSLAKIEALEDCLKSLKKDANLNVQELISSAKTRGELNAAQKKFAALQAKLEQEQAAKNRLESQLQQASSDVEQLKQDFNQSEKDKLEAQTRLEVLSGYFREKETQLQKELSMQEAKWLQHQGENASTVETQTLMKTEIQNLKSQNDELRAEIEAQIASHKAQMGTLENRAHESWLAARQSERRCEEALAEAAGLRRKLTAMASGNAGPLSSLDPLLANGGSANDVGELKNAPSPLPLPGSPMLNMPNPLPFLAAPFTPFMGLPPPFLPPVAAGGARPPPLGRMRSPPPSSSRGDRYSPRHGEDYSDYDDYDDDDDDERLMDQRRRHSGSWGRRDSYLHSPRTYRSLSPSDSRYNYNDTETDFSPPPSPPPPQGSSSSSHHHQHHHNQHHSHSRSNNSRPISEV